jgi:hypothetical protein
VVRGRFVVGQERQLVDSGRAGTTHRRLTGAQNLAFVVYEMHDLCTMGARLAVVSVRKAQAHAVVAGVDRRESLCAVCAFLLRGSSHGVDGVNTAKGIHKERHMLSDSGSKGDRDFPLKFVHGASHVACR